MITGLQTGSSFCRAISMRLQMEVIIRPDVDRAVDLVVKLIVALIKEKPNATLGLATGRTMERVYARLVASGISFADCRTFNLDEYIGLPPDDPNS